MKIIIQNKSVVLLFDILLCCFVRGERSEHYKYTKFGTILKYTLKKIAQKNKTIIDLFINHFLHRLLHISKVCVEVCNFKDPFSSIFKMLYFL